MSLKRLIVLAGVAVSFSLTAPDASAQDLNSAIHYASRSPADARFELLQSALVARLTLLVDKYSGDVFELVKTKNDEFSWEKIFRIKSETDAVDGTHVNFQVFTSGLAAKYTYLLNIHTGQTWVLTNDKDKEILFWDPIWDPMHVSGPSPPSAAIGGQPAAGTAPSDTRSESPNTNIIRNWSGRKGDHQ